MENKFAIVIADTKVSDKLQKDLLLLGFSRCSVFSSIDSLLITEPRITPDLVLAEFKEENEKHFLALKVRIQDNFGSNPILFILDERFAKSSIDRGLLNKIGYLTHSYTSRELELCIEASLTLNGQIETPHVWLNQSELLALFDTLPNGILISDEKGKILNANRALTEILGYSLEEFCSKSIKDLIPKEKHEFVDKNIERVLKGETLHTEAVNICKNGERKSLEIIDTRILLSDRKYGLLIISSDITHWKDINSALKESEEKYRILVEKSNDGIVFVQEGKLIYGNPKIMEMIGITSNQFIGQPIDKYLHFSEVEKINSNYKKRLASEGALEIYETLIQKVNGEIIPVEFNVNTAFYRGKKTTMVFVRDISERKNAEAVLVESEEKYRTLAEQVPVGLYRTSEPGKFFYANPTLAQILGFDTVDDLMTHNVNEFFSKHEDRVENLELLKKSNGYIQSEFELIRKDGKKIWIRDNGKSNFSSQGDLLFFDGVVENITEQKEANEALKENETNLKAMLNAIPDLLFRINRKGVYVGFLSAQNDKQNTPLDRIIGATLNDFFPKEVNERIHSAIKKCLETEELQTIEYPFTINSEVQFFEARIVPANKDEVFCLARNITSRKKNEEKIKMLAQTIMNIHECISITDANDHLIYVNPALLKTYGYEEAEIIGKNISILRSHSLSEAQGSEIYNSTLNGGWQGEVLNTRKDGSEFPISLSTAVVNDDNNKPVAFVGVANDITDRKIAEQDLIRAKEKAEESDRLKTAFLANMSHEIRSPMNAILGFIRIIKEEEKLSENGKQYIELVTNSGAQLVSVIEDILDTSKIQANQLKLSLREFDLNALLIDLYTIYSAQVKEKYRMSTIMLPPVLPYSSPFLIYSDDMRIRQILNNLLSNAIKFTSKGLIEFGYSVFVDDINPRIQFFVKDTGIGLAPDALELIFERFRQADDSYTRMYGGSGLGLAISKGLIELLGGEIWVESKEGKGSVFYFSLPFKKMISSGKEKLSDNTKESTIRVDGLNWADKTILVIEDMQDIQYFLKRVFLKTDVSLLFAGTKKEARAIFKGNSNIDLVLLDIRLPDGDGYDLSVEFKVQNPKIPIIAQTAYAMEGEKEKSILFGCDDFITKPINADLLFLKIDTLLKRVL